MVTQRNLEQVPNVSKTLKTGEEKFEVAIQGERIINSPVESLKEVLRVAMLKLGIRGHNLPTDEEKYILLQHISENYGNHTPAEIGLAFELALAGKLEIEVSEVKAYENFSCLYFSIIMNAYRNWTTPHYYKISAKKKRLELPYEMRTDLTKDEMNQWINEWDKAKFDSLISPHYIPVIFYEWLISTKAIELTKEEKIEYVQKAISIQEQHYYSLFISSTANQRDYDNFITQKKDNNFDYLNDSRIQNIAKKLVVYDYFKKKFNDNNG